MIKNYFKIALRNLWKNKVFSSINIFGLAMGLACCMLIAVYVYDELSYDKYPEKAGQIYRVEVNVTGNGGVETYPNVDIAVGEGMKNAFPEVQASTRLMGGREFFVKYGDKQFKEQKLASADSNFLQIFSIPFIEGNAKTALSEPNSIVITKTFAKKYFGNEEPIGKSLIIGISTVKVTGLLDKVPDNSHFHFDAFMSMSFGHSVAQTWSNIGFYTYLVLNKDADPKKLEAKFPDLVAKHVVPEVVHDMGVSLAEARKSVNTFRFFLEPLTHIHLYSNTKYELEANGDIQYVYIFSALAIFIMLLACVNFTNLSTASSAKRAREVGIRKVMGSEKKQLVFQFLAESVLLTYCAIFFAFIIVYALMPYFDQLSGKHTQL
jgi:putative ABC transport system permease protein